VKIGILALQGDFREHGVMVKRCGCTPVEVRLPEELEPCDALIIPGGESTTMAKLMVRYGFIGALQSFVSSNRPVLGTCAGAILLADCVAGEPNNFLTVIDIDIERNAYGRQRESREADIMLTFSSDVPFNAVFIRAPIIRHVGPAVDTLALYNNSVVLARQGNILVATFHPELTEDERIHRYFITMISHEETLLHQGVYP